MEYEINSCGYDIVFDSATIDTTIGEETIIEVEQAINYIKSGEQEIKNYVDNVSKPELDNHVETVNKAEVSRYITEEKQPEIDEYIDNYINTESKPELNNYLQNDIKPVLQVFANEKTLEFDNNAQTKQALVDASAQAAANSEITATEKANSASQSASEAKASENNAKISETNAKASENSCKDILERLGTVIKIKGRVDSIDDLPTSGNLNGDVYLVGAEGLESYPEYYWFDDHWEFIGTSSNKMEWGTLQGTLSNQTDLQQALDSKVSKTTFDNIISSVNTELNKKQATITGAASSIISSNLTDNRVLISNNSGKVAVSDITSTELGYLDGLTSNIQSQLNGKTTVSVIDNKINIMLSTIYPVGSVYMGTQSTCPLATLISGSSWEKIATNIVVSVDTNAPVKGTGMALGLTNGTRNIGLGYNNAVCVNDQSYGSAVGTSTGSAQNPGAKTLGLTTDSSNSGITATVTRTNLTINIWKRTA